MRWPSPKAQHAILGFWLVPLFAGRGHPQVNMEKVDDGGRSIHIVLLAAVWIREECPVGITPHGVFTMAFYRILPHSKNVEQTISALGMDELTAGISECAPSPRAHRWRRRLAERHSGSRIFTAACFVLPDASPRRLHGTHSLAGDEVYVQRPNLGNSDMRTGYPRFRRAGRFLFWSRIKEASSSMSSISALFLWPFSVWRYRRDVAFLDAAPQPGPGRRGGWVALIGMAFTAMCASLADGEMPAIICCSTLCSILLRLDGLPERPRVAWRGNSINSCSAAIHVQRLPGNVAVIRQHQGGFATCRPRRNGNDGDAVAAFRPVRPSGLDQRR